MGKIIPFVTKKIIHRTGFEVFTFFWGTAIWDCEKEEWERIILNGGERELILSGIDVIIHDNGIEFLPYDYKIKRCLNEKGKIKRKDASYSSIQYRQLII